jgi:hypothetical protein
MRGVCVLLMEVAAVGAAEPQFQVENATTPRFTVVNKAAPKSVCNCADTGDCLCWESKCGCKACGLGTLTIPKPAEVRPVPFSESTKGTNAPARSGTDASTSGATSSLPTSPAPTGTGRTTTAPALGAVPFGTTGNCPT